LLCFFLVLRHGATYAGVRHALPAVPFFAILAGMTSHIALMAKTKTPIILVALAFLVAVVSALPVSRPWEYFNETMDLLLRRSIQDQIGLVSIQPLDQSPPLRNPALE
jgi:hypothetical protein